MSAVKMASNCLPNEIPLLDANTITT